jgi:hypothetical protein
VLGEVKSPAARAKPVAFPPNYHQERSNRNRSKQQKALEKQQKREEKSAQRKQDQPHTEAEPMLPPAKKDS